MNLLAAATITPKILASTRLAGTGATAVYTVPALTTAKVTQAAVCNTSASAVNVTVSVVPLGSTDDGTHTVVHTYSLAANDTLSFTAYLADAQMGPGDFVSVTAGTGAVVTVLLTGIESA